jgi:hypothetical protein
LAVSGGVAGVVPVALFIPASSAHALHDRRAFDPEKTSAREIFCGDGKQNRVCRFDLSYLHLVSRNQ